MHLCALDDGDNCVWDELVKESQDLWINGIIVKRIKYRVAITRVPLDGSESPFSTYSISHILSLRQQFS
jgi:hypothetical protein